MEKGVTPPCDPWRMENVNYHFDHLFDVTLPVPATSSVRRQFYIVNQVRNRRLAVEPSPRILHSSPVEEKKLDFPFSENGPSAIQEEGTTATFFNLREWEERGVTTPNVRGSGGKFRLITPQ